MIILVKYYVFFQQKKVIIYEEGGIEYVYKTDAAKGGGVGQMLTLADEGWKGVWLMLKSLTK